MKYLQIVVLLAVQLPLLMPARAQNESLASMVTNANARPRVLPRRTSIILISLHDLGYGDLSCYGQTNFQTPNIDRLAAEGIRFTNYRSTSDALEAAQGALMTGTDGPLKSGEMTLAARLKRSGYHTGLIGEWTLGREPWTQGFDEFAGYLDAREGRNYYSDFVWRYMPKAPSNLTNATVDVFSGRESIYANANGQKNWYMPDAFVNMAGNFVRAHKPNVGNHYQPFFLMLNLPAPESATAGRDDFPVPTDAPFTDEPWPQAAKNRASMMTRLDDDVGRLVQELNQMQMTNNVAIFLTAAAAPEPFAGTNLNFLKAPGEVRGGESAERLRVPMIVRWVGRVPDRRTSPVPWSAPDFAPTALDIAFEKPAPSSTGRSVLDMLEGREKKDSSGTHDALPK